MKVNQEKRLVLLYKKYLHDLEFDWDDEIYLRDRHFGQLIYNRFGKIRIGISKDAILSKDLTDDHYNNCQQVGKYLAESDKLSFEEFKVVVIESSKTIRVTKKQNQILRNYQKNKPYGKGIEAYSEANIEYETFF
jgi:hypothetical protein